MRLQSVGESCCGEGRALSQLLCLVRRAATEAVTGAEPRPDHRVDGTQTALTVPAAASYEWELQLDEWKKEPRLMDQHSESCDC